jgi:hypothetical protein
VVGLILLLGRSSSTNDVELLVLRDGYLDPQGLVEVVEGRVWFIALMVEYG